MNVLVTHAKITQPVLILSTSSAVIAYLDLMEHSVIIIRPITFYFNANVTIVCTNFRIFLQNVC